MSVNNLLYIREFSREFYFYETSHPRKFSEMAESLSFTDAGKSCHIREFKRFKYVFNGIAKIILSNISEFTA